MDDSWQQFRACSNRSSSQHFPLPGSRNQIDMNFGQYSHPYYAQEVCVIERTIRQEPFVPNTPNYGCPGFGSKMGRPDIDNSFLALLSRPSHQFRSDYQQSSNLRSAAVSGNSPFYQISAPENGVWPSLSASDISSVNQANGNVGFGSGREVSQIGVSRELSSSYNRVTAFHDICEPGNFRIHGPAVSKQVIRQSVNEAEAELQASVPQWLTDAANVRQQQSQSMQSVRSSKSLMETGCSEVEQCSMIKSMPRVACMGTSGLLRGELVFSDKGLGVRCSCHGYQMSVAKFSEHSGLSSGNPGTAVRMESGETIFMWWKAILTQFGVKAPDDERGWDWPDANLTETGTAKYKSTSSQNMEKENASSYRMDNSTVKARNIQSWNNPVDRNNTYEGHATQGLSNGSFLPSTVQRNVHEVRETLLKNFSRVCKGSMPTQLNPQLSEKFKENLPRASNMSSNNSYRGSPNYVNTSGAEYIDFINNCGQSFFPNQGPSGIKSFQKGFTVSSLNNIQEPIPSEKDSMSSSFELRLGQPSQQTHALHGPLQPSLDPQVSNATMDRHKPLFLERMVQRVYDRSVPEGTQQSGSCNLPAFSGNKEKGKERQFENHLYGIGRSNVMESGCIDHLKEDSMRGSVMSMFLQSGGHSVGAVREVPLQSMNIVMGDPEQLLNKLTHFNADSHVLKHDALGALRNQVVGLPNKGYIQSMDYGSNPSQSKFGTTVGPSAAACDMYESSSSLVQTKQRFDNRLLHEVIPSQCLPLEVAMHNKQSQMNETQKATVSPIETDIRNGPSLIALSSSFGNSDHSDSFWQRAINSALSKNSGTLSLSASAHLNIPRVAGAVSLSKVTDSVENKVHVEARQMQHMSEEQLRSMLDFRGGIQACKSSETTPDISYQESKSMMSREQGQLAGLFSNITIPVQRSCIQEELRNESNTSQGMSHTDKHTLGNVCGNVTGINHVRNDQAIMDSPEKSNFHSGPSSSQCNTPNSKDQHRKHSSTKDVFVQQIDCGMPSTTDRPLLRVTRLSQCLSDPDGEPSILEQKDSNRDIASEKVGQSGEPESPESKEASRADVPITESKETATSVALGTNSAVVVSVGENDCGTEKGVTQQDQNVVRHDIMNTACQSFQWKEDNDNVVAEAGLMHDESPLNNMDSRETVEDHLADTAAKGSIRSVISTGSPKKKQHLSNVCSKSSENVLSEFSDAGHVINDEICNVDSGGKKLMRTDIVDEGSGIGKCCSSDAIDTGVWTRRKLASVNRNKKLLCSSPTLPYPSTNDVNDASKVRSSLRLKRLSSAAACSLAEKERGVQTIARSGKLEKKRRTMKWKRLDATATTVENNNKMSLSLNHAKCPDSTFLPSAQVMKPIEMQCGTASVSSTPTRGSSLKRKRSVLVSRNPLQYKPDTQDFQEDRRKEESVQQIQFKGDKLVIRIRQASVQGKAKRYPVDGTEQDIERSGSRMVSKCETIGSGKKPSLRNDDVGFPEDKTKLAQCLTSIRAVNSKPTSKTTKMVSLRSILNQPESHLDCKDREKLKQSSITGAGNLTLNKSGGKLGKYSLLKRRLANELPETSKDSVEINPKSDRKEYSGLVNAREIRKRSLCELTGKSMPQNKLTRRSIPGAAAQSKSVCHIDPSNSIGGEFNINHCSVPRGERTLRVRFKCKTKGHFPKPNTTTSAGARTWFSENPPLSLDIVPQCGGLRSKFCAPESGSHSIFVPLVKEKHNISKNETSPIEKPLSSFEKIATKKGLNMRSMVDKKETRVLDDLASKVLSKQKRLKNADKSRENSDKWSEISDISLAVKSGCKTAKINKRSNGHIFVGKHDNNPPRKRFRTENAHPGSNFEADVPCCVCGDSKEEGINRIVQCGHCMIKVHQACYGVSKIPKSGWTCRACKANLSNIVCVLCGYGGGAMTRAQKTRNVVKSLLQEWQMTNDNSLKVLLGEMARLSSKSDTIDEVSTKPFLGISESSKTGLASPGFSTSNITSFGKEECNKMCFRSSLEDGTERYSGQVGKVKKYLNSEFKVNNTITAAVHDPTVPQWVHMVCGLWMPGTRCLNVSTMGIFDVSGAVLPRRKLVCSICNRPGGLCIQCRVAKCSAPFHPWCAHQKGLLQSEIEGDDGDRVGFYGRCMHHGKYENIYSEIAQSGNTLPVNLRLGTEKGTCARTEGYKGRKSWEEYRAELRRKSETNSTKVVSQEQINVWLHINERKSCTRGLIKPPNVDNKTDYRREYLRFKQEQGWKRLVVYKSGIHALGLYTAEFISKGEMVVEYVGEIVGLRVADKREANYHSRGKMQYEGACYFFRIDKESIIDATRKGGIARFVNHSCSPNCVAKVISVKTQKKVVFFAVRDINAGEEITYDYHFNHEDDGKKIPCFCNSRTCRRYLN